jgi:hypothetical protein
MLCAAICVRNEQFLRRGCSCFLPFARPDEQNNRRKILLIKEIRSGRYGLRNGGNYLAQEVHFSILLWMCVVWTQ